MTVSSGSFNGGSSTICRKVAVVRFVAAPERGADIRCQRQLVLQAERQIRIRAEMTAERYQIGIARGHDRLCASAVKTACSDDRTGEVRAQILDCDRLLTFVQRVVTLDARFDHMQVSDLVAVQ